MKYRKILSTSFATLLLANTGAPVVANATTETKGKMIDQSVLDNVFRTDIDLNAINYTTLTKEEESLQTETIDDTTTSVEEQIEDNEVGAVSVEEEPISIEESQQEKNEANSSSTSSIEENNTNEAENSNDTTEEKESDKKTEDTVGNESDENKKDNDIKNSDASDEQAISSDAEKENEPKKEKSEMENKEAEETGDWGTTTWKAQLQEDGSYLYTVFSGETGSADEAPWKTNKGTFRIKFDGKVLIKDGVSLFASARLLSLEAENIVCEGSLLSMFSGASSLTSLDLSGFDTSNVTSMQSMFQNVRSLTSLDLSGFDTSNVTSMQYMFSGASSLTSLDLSGFDTSNVTSMQYMFSGASSLTSLDVSGWNTNKVTDMYNMFNGASKIKTLKMNNWNMSTWTNLNKLRDGIFQYLPNLETLEAKSWNLQGITNLSYLFLYETSLFYKQRGTLKTANFSGWDTRNVKDMRYMFYNASSLTSLDVSGFNTSNVTTMESMFEDASSLTSLDVSGFNTSKVTNMQFMFAGASSLTSLDLSGFNTSKVTNMQFMFINPSLEKLTLGDKFKFLTTAALPKPNVPPNKSTGKWTREDGQSNSYTPTEFMEKYGTGDLKAGTYVGDISIPFTLSNFSSEATIIGQKVSTSFEIDYENLADNYFENGMMQFAVTGDKLPKEIEYDSVTVSYISGNGQASQIKDVRYDKANNTIYFDVTQGTAALVNKIRVSLNGTAWNNTSTTEDNHTFVVDYNTDEKGPIENSYLVASISGKVDVNNGNLSFESVPDTLAFKPTKLIVTKEDIIIDRLLSDWNIQVSDWRGTNVLPGTTDTISRQNWDMVATSEEFEDSKGEKVSPTAIGLVYVNEHGDKKELSADQEVLIESHSVDGETPKENHNVTISWGEETGLKTVVKNRNALNSNEEYSARVKYELRVAP
ncbi:BspA family leucine-rich repeat surface protein [Enterococcus faecalis]|uniref:BspA family leucine-rich repeat surface protein n=1 Tax=Enterococcus faecalis TaxID=1351 RepID=UPI003A9509AC